MCVHVGFFCLFVFLLDPRCRGSEFCNGPLKSDFYVRKKITCPHSTCKFCLLNLYLDLLFTFCFNLKPPGKVPPPLHVSHGFGCIFIFMFWDSSLQLPTLKDSIPLSSCFASLKICPLMPQVCQAIPFYKLLYPKECSQAKCSKFTNLTLLQSILQEYPSSICIQIIIIKYHFQILYFLSVSGIVWPSYSIITWSWNTLLTLKLSLSCVWHFRVSFYFLVSFLCYFSYPLRPPYSPSYTWTLKSILLKQIKHIFKNT